LYFRYFQLYQSRQFYLWRKTKYPEKPPITYVSIGIQYLDVQYIVCENTAYTCNIHTRGTP
jgi:hypothetical protein